MKTQSPFFPVPRIAKLVRNLRSRRMQGRSNVATAFCLALSTAFFVVAIPTAANEELPPMQGAGTEHGRHFDWMMHTQRTLDELKGKLNLAPAQSAGWNTWSQGVIDDGKQQLALKKSEHDQKQVDSKEKDGETTPEKMARGIEHLKSETAWMQEHLVQLEAAQIRTSDFYAVLDTNQKTIFDLFWHELYHRVSGHDQGSNVPVAKTLHHVT